MTSALRGLHASIAPHFVTLLLLVSLPSPWAFADDAPPCHGRGPYGSQLTTLLIDPITPDTMYAGTCCSGMFRSTDRGQSWRRYGCPRTMGSIWAMAVDPRQPGKFFVAASGRLFSTTDDGKRWTWLRGVSGWVVSLALDAAHSEIVYAGSLTGGSSTLFRSADGGKSFAPVLVAPGLTWPRIFSTDSGLGAVTYAVFLPDVRLRRPEDLWETVALRASDLDSEDADGPGRTILRSEDGGTSWTDMGSSMPTRLPVTGVAVAASHPSVVYAATYDGVFKTIDSGATWTAANRGLPEEEHPVTVAVDPANPETAYAGFFREGLFKSVDGGGSWTRVRELPLQNVKYLAADPGPPHRLYAGQTPGPVYQSMDQGGTWVEVHVGLDRCEAVAD